MQKTPVNVKEGTDSRFYLIQHPFKNILILFDSISFARYGTLRSIINNGFPEKRNTATLYKKLIESKWGLLSQKSNSSSGPVYLIKRWLNRNAYFWGNYVNFYIFNREYPFQFMTEKDNFLKKFLTDNFICFDRECLRTFPIVDGQKLDFFSNSLLNWIFLASGRVQKPLFWT